MEKDIASLKDEQRNLRALYYQKRERVNKTVAKIWESVGKLEDKINKEMKGE